ncbi:hypothetical protein CMO88_02525 [Candidatus Woesearchaeota archaeon]|nr:hypothetical protein [Candidatus Woesearchaeota archaeon]|tara:strand:+ start:1179 stop:1568 length:390 start_codon:yes stop_codon:yes gene_type:complete
MNSKGQTVSTDAFIAVALFLVVIIFFFSLSSDKLSETKVQDLQTESTKLVSSISGTRNSSLSFLDGTKVDAEKLESLSDLDYKQLKDTLGVDADFCIHFEDEKGNVINISKNKTGIGSLFVTVGGINCG